MKLTAEGKKALTKVAQTYGLSQDATMHLWHSIVTGKGSMAQFNHPELGGMGQWMKGGMTMLGDMFNHSLKSSVSNACEDLSAMFFNSAFVTRENIIPMYDNIQPTSWWPEEWGSPSMSGAQNDMRYAYFPHHDRLVIQNLKETLIYDTKGYLLQGVSQQQSGTQNLTFSSQKGQVSTSEFERVNL